MSIPSRKLTSAASRFADFSPTSAHVFPPSSGPASTEVGVSRAEDKSGSGTSSSTIHPSSRVLEGGTSELGRNEIRENSHSSHELDPIRANNQQVVALFGIEKLPGGPAAASVTAAGEAASNSNSTAQNLQRQRDPRDVQAVFHALVSHVLRVEPSQEPEFALKVTSITTCSIIVHYNLIQFICTF